VLNEQGRQAENITRDTLRQVEGATVEPNVKIGKGQGSVIDNVVKATKGGKSVTVFVETKLTIREINDRIVGQLTNAVKAAKPGDSVILQVARQPTTSEIAALREGLGKEVFQRIQIVSKQTDLLEAVKAAFK